MKLFEPITIRGMEFKNRIVMAAMAIGTYGLGFEGTTETIINFWAERARGGVGSMIIGAVSPAYSIPEEDLKQGISPSRYIDAMSRLAAEVHKSGTKFGVQLWYTNLYPSGAVLPPTGQEWVAPSPRVENIYTISPPARRCAS